MSDTELDSKILRAYFNNVNKLFTNFNEGTLTSFVDVMKNELCDDNGQIDFKKYQPDDNYLTLLRSYMVIIALKNANTIYNNYFQLFEADKSKTVNTDRRSIVRRKRVNIPDGWKVIKGGKNKNDGKLTRS